MSQQTVDQAAQNLRDFKKILDELGVPFWLDGGTLLGAYRDKDFCEDDETDIDLGTWSKNQSMIPDIIARAEQAGFVLHKHWTGDRRAPGKAPEIALKRHNLKIDVFFYERKGEDAWAGTYINDDTLLPQVVPVHFFDSLGRLEFKGENFPVPEDTAGYLSHRYGDWQTKIHRNDYSCLNPEQIKSLKPHYRFWE